MRSYVSWKTTGYYRKDSLNLTARCFVSGCWPSCFSCQMLCTTYTAERDGFFNYQTVLKCQTHSTKHSYPISTSAKRQDTLLKIWSISWRYTLQEGRHFNLRPGISTSILERFNCAVDYLISLIVPCRVSMTKRRVEVVWLVLFIVCK